MNVEAYVAPEGSIPTLPVPDLAAVRRAHLIGVGGAGMSGIARLLLARGVAVSGSDLKDSRGLEALRKAGATIFIGHAASQVGRPDAVVISSAIPEANSELADARRRDLSVFARAQILAALAAGHRTLAVTGTHGKTTTTSILSVILDRAGLDPTFVIGGDLNESGSGAGYGAGDIFVAEADESDGSFLLLRPAIGIVTNVEEDHLDFYRGGRAEIEAAFTRFCERSAKVLACGDDAGVRAVLARANGVDAVTYGLDMSNDVRVVPGGDHGEGARGAVLLDDERIELSLRLPGVHNLMNATAAFLAAVGVGVAPDVAARGAGAFTGVRRRFDRRGVVRGVVFVDDYAHHPTELAATLEAARHVGASRIVAVFQPHRYTRTRSLWRELGESLAAADLVVVTDVYGAGEQPIPGVSGQLVVDALARAAPGTRIVYLARRIDLAPFLADEVREGDLVLTLGAGDITMVADETIDRIRERA